jgi:hypothetical protein
MPAFSPCLQLVGDVLELPILVRAPFEVLSCTLKATAMERNEQVLLLQRFVCTVLLLDHPALIVGRLLL